MDNTEITQVKKRGLQCLAFALCKLSCHQAASGINEDMILHRRRTAVGNESALPVQLQIGPNGGERMSEDALVPVEWPQRR